MYLEKRAGRWSIPLRHNFCHFITERYPMSHLVVYPVLPVDRAVREETQAEVTNTSGKEAGSKKRGGREYKKNWRIVLAIVKRNPWARWERRFLRGRLPRITRFFRELYYHPCPPSPSLYLCFISSRLSPHFLRGYPGVSIV